MWEIALITICVVMFCKMEGWTFSTYWNKPTCECQEHRLHDELKVKKKLGY